MNRHRYNIKRKRLDGRAVSVPALVSAIKSVWWDWIADPRFLTCLALIGCVLLSVFCTANSVYKLSPAFTPTIEKGLTKGLPEPWLYRIVEGTALLIIGAGFAIMFAKQYQRLMFITRQLKH
jgi:hypothetical protein